MATLLLSKIITFIMLIKGLEMNSLNGQHLRVVWPRWEGNPKGLAGPTNGGVILDYLSARFNFTYEMVRVTENRLEPKDNSSGLFNYLWDKQCDLIIYPVVPSLWRNSVIDMTWPCYFDVIAFLIPVPDANMANVEAAIKPFQWLVWLLLAISTGVVLFVLKQLTWHYLRNKAIIGKNEVNRKNAETQIEFLYVFGLLLSQGGHLKNSRLPFRIVAGVWVLAAFVLVQAYQSTLITYVTAPITSPLINSAYDIAESKDIHLLMKKEGTLQALLKRSDNPLFKKMVERIDTGCNFVSECISKIKPGSKNVFADPRSFQIEAITEDFKRTGKCNLQLARDDFLYMIGTLALAKNSPYTKTISQGLMVMHEIGLTKYWDLWYPPVSHHCLDNMKRDNIKSSTSKKPPTLTLKNLTSAFIILFVGVGLSLLAFIFELISSVSSRAL